MSVIDSLELKLAALEACVDGLNDEQALIARLKGRIIPFDFVVEQDFTAAISGSEGARMRVEVTEDGPFVMTNYPYMVWKPTLPTNADSFGIWRSISHFAYPDQADFGAATDHELNVINLSWELTDTKSGRRFQSTGGRPANATQVSNLFARTPSLLSSWPGLDMRLPQHCFFDSGTTIIFTPFYEDVRFATGGEATNPPTQGTLRVVIPGYRIIS